MLIGQAARERRIRGNQHGSVDGSSFMGEGVHADMESLKEVRRKKARKGKSDLGHTEMWKRLKRRRGMGKKIPGKKRGGRDDHPTIELKEDG